MVLLVFQVRTVLEVDDLIHSSMVVLTIFDNSKYLLKHVLEKQSDLGEKLTSLSLS